MKRSRLDRILSAIVYAMSTFLFVMAWSTVDATYAVSSGVQPVIAALAALPLVAIRSNPVLGWTISAVAGLAIPLVYPSTDGAFPWQMVHLLVLVALLFAVAVRCRLPAVLLAWSSTCLLLLVNAAGQTGAGFAGGITVVVLIGLLIRGLLVSRRQLASQRRTNELERARRSVLEERARIARDLHDVIAHHMSIVVVQAQSAPYRLTSVTEETKAELDAIGANVRASLNEIRAVLGVLRSDDDATELSPQPGVAGVTELVENSRSAGVDVSLNISGDPPPISELSGVAVYRIVQESLANAVRHCPGAPVTVTMEHGPDATAVTVSNGPAAVPGSSGNSSGGHGIAGMRERAAAMGGSVDAQTRPDGGFEVRAHIPAAIRTTPGAL
ncbi:histidine kinase [Mycobacterium sp. DL99]|uniref:sensor histidine kinase n=1 Tax=Mycobacterium sp. DL99 TaxID=2528957 RepID=UPI0025703FEA|nr:histidine kinase [Mycobacterium sp. DL99]